MSRGKPNSRCFCAAELAHGDEAVDQDKVAIEQSRYIARAAAGADTAADNGSTRARRTARDCGARARGLDTRASARARDTS